MTKGGTGLEVVVACSAFTGGPRTPAAAAGQLGSLDRNTYSGRTGRVREGADFLKT